MEFSLENAFSFMYTSVETLDKMGLLSNIFEPNVDDVAAVFAPKIFVVIVVAIYYKRQYLSKKDNYFFKITICCC